jgi:hypothetical protein
VAFTNIEADEVNFCVTLLARLGGRHLNDPAGPVPDHDVSEDTRNFVRETEAKSGWGQIWDVYPSFLRSEHWVW